MYKKLVSKMRSRPRLLGRIAKVALTLGMVCSSVNAFGMFTDLELPEIIRQSDYVVVGRVIDTEVVMARKAGKYSRVCGTAATVEVIQTLKGRVPQRVVVGHNGELTAGASYFFPIKDGRNNFPSDVQVIEEPGDVQAAVNRYCNRRMPKLSVNYLFSGELVDIDHWQSLPRYTKRWLVKPIYLKAPKSVETYDFDYRTLADRRRRIEPPAELQWHATRAGRGYIDWSQLIESLKSSRLAEPDVDSEEEEQEEDEN